MERRLDCAIVKDLLPLYVEGMVSNASKESIEEHLKSCEECEGVRRNMAYELEEETAPPQVQDVKRFLKKTKRMFFLYGLGGLSLIAILVCLIVDLALNRGVTWSLIVGSSVLYADVLAYVLTVCKKDKCLAAMAVLSIGTWGLLAVIQFAGYQLMDVGTFWLFRYGYPIMSVWLAVLWIPVLLRRFLKWDLWDCIALLLFLTVPGNYVTKLITGDYMWIDVLHLRGFVSDALGEVVAGIICWLIGRIRKKR